MSQQLVVFVGRGHAPRSCNFPIDTSFWIPNVGIAPQQLVQHGVVRFQSVHLDHIVIVHPARVAVTLIIQPMDVRLLCLVICHELTDVFHFSGDAVFSANHHFIVCRYETLQWMSNQNDLSVVSEHLQSFIQRHIKQLVVPCFRMLETGTVVSLSGPCCVVYVEEVTMGSRAPGFVDATVDHLLFVVDVNRNKRGSGCAIGDGAVTL